VEFNATGSLFGKILSAMASLSSEFSSLTSMALTVLVFIPVSVREAFADAIVKTALLHAIAAVRNK
jgi:uncharacterized membrane protein YqjE